MSSSLPHDFSLSPATPNHSEPQPTAAQGANFHMLSYLLGLITSLLLVGGALFLVR
ncbi:MAG: hypothetical protein M3Q45_09450 [Chloroflexota bacterium]|nr:hypothetical protein [Chloroflexota bacterium]